MRGNIKQGTYGRDRGDFIGHENSLDVCCICDITARSLALTQLSYYQHRGDLRGTPGSACPQPEPNATELPSCARISTRAAPRRRRRRRRWRGEEGARHPGPEGQVLRRVLWHVFRSALHRVLDVLVLHVSSKGGVVGGGGGSRPGRRAPQHTSFCHLNNNTFTCLPFTK